MKQKPWSKLKREICALFSPDIKIRLHCAAYRMKSQRGSTDLPRYWITLNKETIWDYPHDFKNQAVFDHHSFLDGTCGGGSLLLRDTYPYGSETSTISGLIREYIDTPRAELLIKSFEKDWWGLTDILRAADRRIGKQRLPVLQRLGNAAVDKIVAERLKAAEASCGRHRLEP
jgi:hypothetical protein